MNIKITKAGVLATLQDAGRFGNRSVGIGSGGAMDTIAMKLANFLVGNKEDATVIEMHFPAPEILFEQDAIISLAGADFKASINEMGLPVYRTAFIKKGTVLKFSQPISGTRLYMAVHGGWQAQKWLDSYSTHLKLTMGGHCGRALKKDDVIHFSKNNFSFAENTILSWCISQHELDNIYEPSNKIRCIKGIEYDLMDDPSKQKLEQNKFIISNQSDRMGYRLTGNTISLHQQTESISSAVDAGIVQLLPDGNCIVLMADHQTTGGYPRIASVIKTDLPKLLQAKPGQPVNFTIISLQQAEDAFIALQKKLNDVKAGCHLKLEKYL